MKRVGIVFVVLAGLAATVYVPIWWFLIPGIVDMVQGAKGDSVDKTRILWGIIQFFVLAELSLYFIWAITMSFGALIGLWPSGWWRSKRRQRFGGYTGWR